MLSILGLAEAEGLLADAVLTARDAFEENNAALEEAVKRYSTTASQIEITKNVFNELSFLIILLIFDCLLREKYLEHFLSIISFFLRALVILFRLLN